MVVFIAFQDKGFYQNPQIVGVFPTLAYAKEHLSALEDFEEIVNALYVEEWHGTEWENTYYLN